MCSQHENPTPLLLLGLDSRGHCVFILPNLLVVCRIRKAFFLSSHKVKVCLQCLQKKRRGGQTWRDFLLIHLYVCLTFHTFLFLKGFFCPLEVHYIGHELDFILGKNANVYFSWDRKSFQYSNMWLEMTWQSYQLCNSINMVVNQNQICRTLDA